MIETLQKKITRLKWKERGCSTVAPIARCNDKGSLLFIWHWYDICKEHMSMYMDTLYSQTPISKSKYEPEKSHMEYEGVRGTYKQEWMDKKEPRHRIFRIECTMIAKKSRRLLVHPI